MKFGSDIQIEGTPSPNTVHQVLVGVLRHDAYLRGLLDSNGVLRPEAIQLPEQYLRDTPVQALDLNTQFSRALQKFRFDSGVNAENFSDSLKATLAHSVLNHHELLQDLKRSERKLYIVGSVRKILSTVGIGAIIPDSFVERFRKERGLLKLKLYASAHEQAALSEALEG